MGSSIIILVKEQAIGKIVDIYNEDEIHMQ